MMLLYWLLQLVLIVPVATELKRRSCNTSEDNLYIIVDSSNDLNLTSIQIQYFVQNVISKSDNSFKTQISLIEPFQQKVLRCLNVSSTQEILDYLVEINLLLHLNKSSVNDLSALSDAVSFTYETIKHDTAEDEEASLIIAWFSVFFENCMEILKSVLDVNAEFVGRKKSFFVPCLLIGIENIHDLFLDYAILQFNLLVLPSYYDYNTNLNVLQLFLQCPAGWVDFRINNYYSFLNCYKIEMLPKKVNWADASKHCRHLASDLPTIESNEELQFLKTTLHNAINDTTTGTTFVYVGLTKTSVGLNIFQWTNQRPFILGQNTNIQNNNDKCVVLNYSFLKGKKNESIGENDRITWVLVDCREEWTEIILCKLNLDATVYGISQQSHPDRQSLENKMLSLNAEFIFDAKENEIYSVVNQYRRMEQNSITENKELLFDCEDDTNLIVYSQVCNYLMDCPDGRDESHCTDLRTGMKSNFFCVNPNKNGIFPFTENIPIENKCNLYQDCPDNSDEEGCDECMERRCSDGTCVPSHWLTSDGEECRLYNNSNGHAFINVTVEGSTTKQHEVVHCNQLEDLNPIYKPSYNKETYNWAPKCLFLRGRSGLPIGCNDMSHLQNCGNFTCAEEFIKCHDSYCIPFYLVEDEVMDCPHGEEESIAIPYNKSGYFICNINKHNFLHPVQVCDGVAHCPHGDDELNCNVTCPPGFKCFGSAVMVNNISEVEEIKSFRMFDIQTKYLKLSGLDLSRLSENYILPNLLELHASNCNLTNLDLFGGAWSLYYLDLSYNKFTMFFPHTDTHLDWLRFLNFSGNINLSFFDIKSRTYSLKELDVSHTHMFKLDDNNVTLTNAFIYLNVANTKIVSLKVLDDYAIKVLEYLNIRNTLLKESDTVNLLSKRTITTALYVDNFKYCCPQVVGTGIPKHVCHAPFDGISSCEDLIGDILKRSLLWLAALLSLVGNIMVLTFRILYDRGILKKGYGVFVTSLGIADFIMGVYLTIIASMDIYFRDNYVIYETDWRFSILCKVSGFLSTLSSETSTFFVLLITLERLLVIRFPFGEYRLTKLVVILLVVTSWTIGFILALIPILFPQWTIYSSNGMCVGLPLTTDRQLGWQYPFGVFIVFNFICFLVIAFGQVLIFISMSSQRFIATTLNATRRQQDINVAKQLFIVALSNFLCWFPICVTGLMSLNGYTVSPDSYAWFVIFVLPLNSAINPMIYTIPAIFKKWIEFNRVKLS